MSSQFIVILCIAMLTYGIMLLILVRISMRYIKNYHHYHEILNLKHGDSVYDKEYKCNAMVEKIDPFGFIVLDKSFGKSSENESIKQTWIIVYGNDGRYSISTKGAEKRLTKNK